MLSEAVKAKHNQMQNPNTGKTIASVVPIDTDSRGEADLTVKSSDLLTHFPEEIQTRLRPLERFVRPAVNLSYYIPIMGDTVREPVYSEGRSHKVPRTFRVGGNDQLPVLLEFKGTGRFQRRAALTHGFPKSGDMVYFASYLDGRVIGAETYDMGLLALLNGTVISFFYMAEHDISLSEALSYGGVTIPLAVRKSKDITNHIRHLRNYVGSDDFCIAISASPTLERQDNDDFSVRNMATRGKALRFLLEHKICFEPDSAHPQQFGKGEDVIFPVYDFADLIFGEQDIPEIVNMQNKFGKIENLPRSGVWTYLTYKALLPSRDNLSPIAKFPIDPTSVMFRNWKNKISAYFHELVKEELSQEQAQRIVDLYPFCPKEVLYFIASRFAEKKNSALTKKLLKTRMKILRSNQFRSLRNYDLSGTEEIDLDEVKTTMKIANEPFYKRVVDYIVNGLSSSGIPTEVDSFSQIVSLIDRVNEVDKILPQKLTAYLYMNTQALVELFKDFLNENKSNRNHFFKVDFNIATADYEAIKKYIVEFVDKKTQKKAL